MRLTSHLLTSGKTAVVQKFYFASESFAYNNSNKNFPWQKRRNMVPSWKRTHPTWRKCKLASKVLDGRGCVGSQDGNTREFCNDFVLMRVSQCFIKCSFVSFAGGHNKNYAKKEKEKKEKDEKKEKKLGCIYKKSMYLCMYGIIYLHSPYIQANCSLHLQHCCS